MTQAEADKLLAKIKDMLTSREARMLVGINTAMALYAKIESIVLDEVKDQ